MLATLTRRARWGALGPSFRALSGFKADPTPPPDPSRMGTADLCDVHLPDPVDVTVERKVAVAEVNYFKDFGDELAELTPIAQLDTAFERIVGEHARHCFKACGYCV